MLSTQRKTLSGLGVGVKNSIDNPAMSCYYVIVLAKALWIKMKKPSKL